MQSAPESAVYRIGDIEVDVTRACIRRGGAETHLKPKSFRVLAHLIEQRDRLVTKDELMELFWKDTAVTDDALTQCIVEVRRALGDNPRDPAYLKTVPRRGYRFVGPVQVGNLDPVDSGVQVQTPVQVESPASGAGPLVRSAPPGPPILRVTNRWLALGAFVTLSVGAAAVWSKLPWSNSPPPIGAKRVVAIMRFENRSGQADLDWLREGLPDMIETTMSRSGALEIVTRERVYARRNSAPVEAVELARASHAEVAVAGSFSKLGDRMRVDARLLEVRTGSLVAAEGITVDHVEQLLSQIDFLAERLASRLAPQGRDRDRRALASLMTENLEAYRSYSLGLERVEAYQTNDAIALFEKSAALDPGFAMAHARIGYAYAVTDSDLTRGRPYLEKAFRMAEKLTERDRRHILAWYSIANSDYPKAIRSYSDLIAEYPNDTEAYLRLAMLLRGESRHEEAVELLRRANAIDPDDPKIYNGLGGVLSEMGRHDEAIDMAGRYVQLAPADTNAYDTLGLAYQSGGQLERAEECFTRALQLNPEFDVAALHRSMLYSEMGRVQDGIRETLRIAEHGGRSRPRALGDSAWIAWRHGRMDQARSLAGRALQSDLPGVSAWNPAFLLVSKSAPTTTAEVFIGRGGHFGDRTVLFFQAQMDLNEGRREQMLEHLRQLVRVRPRWGEVELREDALADGYLQLGRVDEAIAEYERALKVFPGMPMARFHLAQAYQRKGRGAEATVQFKQFLDLWKHADPDLPELAEARRAVSAN